MTIFDSLYCEEKNQLDDDEQQPPPLESYSSVYNDNDNIHPKNTLFEQDLFLEDDELLSTLISKESRQNLHNNGRCGPTVGHRREAVEWILGVVSHYSFSALTAVLAVNYLDRFLEGLDTEKKPWMTQLAAVSCLSLAAKVEETHVPLLLDLQMDRSKYVFEAKTIKKMEILILSSLEWNMNPVTPHSFIDYITRRLGLKSYLSSEFLKRCDSLLLCFLPDCRFRCYLPSVIATATMVHAINCVEPRIGIEFKSPLLGILGINKEEVEDCWKQIQEIKCGSNSGRVLNKRKFEVVPGSPDAIMDLSFSSDESWSVVNPSVSSSPESRAKKARKGVD